MSTIFFRIFFFIIVISRNNRPFRNWSFVKIGHVVKFDNTIGGRKICSFATKQQRYLRLCSPWKWCNSAGYEQETFVTKIIFLFWPEPCICPNQFVYWDFFQKKCHLLIIVLVPTGIKYRSLLLVIICFALYMYIHWTNYATIEMFMNILLYLICRLKFKVG